MIRISISAPKTAKINRAKIQHIVRTVLKGEGVADADISLAFVNNPTIQRLNEEFLGHQGPTDVLTFPLSETGEARLKGELVIGVAVARDEANRRGHAVEAELALYVIHGILHLCGYDDKNPRAVRRMRARERHYLALLDMPEISPC